MYSKPQAACINGTKSSFKACKSRERASCKSCGRINGSVRGLHKLRIDCNPQLIFPRINSPNEYHDGDLSTSLVMVMTMIIDEDNGDVNRDQHVGKAEQ